MEGSFARVDVICRQYCQVSQNYFLPFPRHEDVVLQTLKYEKINIHHI